MSSETAPVSNGRRTNLSARACRLCWNPDDHPDDLVREHIDELETNGSLVLSWRCGNAKIEPGTAIYLLRTGRRAESRGLIGGGVALGIDEPEYEDDSRAVRVRLHALSLQPFLSRAALHEVPFDGIPWSAQTAAVRVDDPAVVRALDQALRRDRVNPGERPRATLVDVEQVHDFEFERIGTVEDLARRTEAELQARYRRAREADGVTLRAYRMSAPGSLAAYRCDLYDPSRRRVIEAKASTARASVRMAIGQLADYRRLLQASGDVGSDAIGQALLVPNRPDEDTLDLLAHCGVTAIWEVGAGSGAFEECGPPIRRRDAPG